MLLLTVTTGMVEAVSFLALGPVFAAVQTGSLLLLGFSLGGAPGVSAAVSAVSLAGFALGAVAGSRVETAIDVRERPWFEAALVVEGVLLGAGALVIWGWASTPRAARRTPATWPRSRWWPARWGCGT
ncbi:DUF1275 family protein [Streptomyces zhihengii]